MNAHDTALPAASRLEPGERHRAAWRAAAWAGFLIFLTAAYFQNTYPIWNVNSQFAMTCALVEKGTFAIDDYHTKTEFYTNDKAFYNGHFYCDKSPVTALLAVPVTWLARTVDRSMGVAFNYARARWWATWLIVGGAAAATAFLTAWLLAQRGVEPTTAARGAALWIASTPMMGYGILLYGYMPACLFFLVGFALIAPAWNGTMREADGNDAKNFAALGGSGTGGSATDDALQPWRWLAAGMAVGLAVWTLNTVALPAVVLTIAIAMGTWRRATASRWAKNLGLWTAGGVLGVAGNFIYTYAIFGTFGSPYAFEWDPVFRHAMSQGLMGATWPKLGALWRLTFHPYQGLLFWFPLVLLATLGCGWLLARGRRHTDRLEAGAALATFAGLLLYFSGYYMWWGGYAYSARHLIPALPMLGLGLAPWLRRAGRLRGWTLAIGVAGLIANVSAFTVNPQPPAGLPDAILMVPGNAVWRLSPMARMIANFWIRNQTDANWGVAIGLHGRLSLAPLAAIWAMAWLALPKWLAWRRATANPTS
jgi:hypothetical protein